MILTFNAIKDRFEFRTGKGEYELDAAGRSTGRLGKFLASQARFTYEWGSDTWHTGDPAKALKLSRFAENGLKAEIFAKATAQTRPTMTYVNGVFIWTGPNEGELEDERGRRKLVIFKEIPRAAKFVFARPFSEQWEQIPRGAAKGFKTQVWWTADVEKALRCIKYADDAAREALQESANRRVNTLAASRATDAEIDIPTPQGIHPEFHEPFEFRGYQKAGVAYGAKKRNVLFGDEPGLGKTLETIGLINYILRNATPEQVRAFRVLIISPASLKINWSRECEWWLTQPLTVGISDTRRNQVMPDTNIVITNYQQLGKKETRKIGEEYDPTCREVKEVFETTVHLRKSLNFLWDMLVVDESHYLKTEDAQRTQLVMAIEARRTVFLSGTPYPNRTRELWVTCHRLAPKVFPDRMKFYHEFCADGTAQYNGAKNPARLQELLRLNFMIRRLKKDVLTELPPKQRQVIELPATGCEHLVSEELKAWQTKADILKSLKLRVELAKASEDPEVYKSAVRMLTAGIRVMFSEISRIRRDTALAKIPMVIKHVANLLVEGIKIILFCHHKEVGIKVLEHFGKQAFLITGDTKLPVRQGYIDRFQHEDGCRLGIGTIGAMGVGVTMTASSHVVFAELDWVPGNVSQAEDRAHRIGQHDAVTIQHLVLDGSLDANMARTLVEKQIDMDATLDEETRQKVLDLDQIDPNDGTPDFALPDKEEFSTHGLSVKAIGKQANEMNDSDIEAVRAGLKMLAGRWPGVDARFDSANESLGLYLADLTTLTPRYAVLGRKVILQHAEVLAGNTEIARLFK